MKLNLRNKFMLPTLTFVIITMIITGSISYVMSKHALEDSINERINSTVMENAVLIDIWLERAKTDIDTWSRFKLVKRATMTSFIGKASRISSSRLLEDVKEKYGFYDLITIVDTNGESVASSMGGPVEGMNISDTDYFKKTLKGKQAVSHMFRNSVTGNLGFFITAPVKNAADMITGLILGFVNLEYIDRKFIDPVRIGNSGYSFLFNPEGVILSHPDKTYVMDMNLTHLDFGKKMQDQKEGLISYSWDGMEMITAFKRIEGINWTLAVSAGKKEILAPVKRISIISIIVSVIGLLIIGVICFIIAQSVTKPMRKLVDVLGSYGEGDMDIRAEVNSRDEIGFFAEKFNAMLEQINASARTLGESESRYRLFFSNLQDAVDKKEYTTRFTPSSREDDLTLSLNRILSTLENAEIKTSSQDWLKSGHADLNNAVSGERDLSLLCRKGITYIAKYIDARVGTFFVRDSGKEEFILSANYAFRERKGLVNRFKPGEGLAGQAVLEKERILFTDVPRDYMKIESSLGSVLPVNILVLPLIFEGDVKGVIELGSTTPFTELQTHFIELAGDILAVALNAAIFNKKLEELLDYTKKQSDEMREQQEELKAANEELEEQTGILKESEAKLQLQQEELQASNEELEEKTEILASQKNEIEKKNTSLTIQQKEIEEKATQLELATRYKSEFLANMSHELRTPLNSLLILANMLSENEEKNLTSDQIESAASIHRSGQNLLRLINDILDLSKIEAKKIELSITKIGFESIRINCKSEFEHMAREKKIRFDIDVDENLPETITTDELRLNQIIRNLMGNAIKFTEEGSVALKISRPDHRVTFDRKDLDPEKTIAISVYDTGSGIPEDQAQLIFQAFKQVDGSISRRHGGTGLGLSISRELAVLIGGELAVQSTPGKGSVFTLYIPEVIAPPGAEDVSSEQEHTFESMTGTAVKALEIPEKDVEKKSGDIVPIPMENGTYNNSKTMLIIEDDNDFAVILADFFQKNGYESIIASDGETGIKFVIEHQPTAIILDIGLPGVDGWAVLGELKTNPATRHIPVHIMSAFDDTRQGLEKGAVGYLTKPVETDGLKKALGRIESVLSSGVKELLIIEDNKELRDSILKLMETNDIHAVAAETGEKALEYIKQQRFDCMILDLGLPDITGFELLDIINTDPEINKIPVIIYTGRDLTIEETRKLERYAASIVLKSAASMERLLDETALFMHRVENEMPEDHKKMIKNLRDRKSILPGKKVLLVDDDMRNAFALNKFLKSKGMEVMIANNGKKALELLDREERPDIVLMDIMMPVMDGYEAMKRIREQDKFKDLPILALTAKAMESDREECIKCGANDYLSKPVDTSKLLTMLRVWFYS